MENLTSIKKPEQTENPYHQTIHESKSATLSIKNVKKLKTYSASKSSRRDSEDAFSYKSHISSVYNIGAPKKGLLAGLAKSNRMTLESKE